MNSTECETCWYYDYDEEFDEYYCMMDLDEDEVYRLYTNPKEYTESLGKTFSCDLHYQHNVDVCPNHT